VVVKFLLISQGDPLCGNNKVFGYNSILHLRDRTANQKKKSTPKGLLWRKIFLLDLNKKNNIKI
jgi:hypothetical protein